MGRSAKIYHTWINQGGRPIPVLTSNATSQQEGAFTLTITFTRAVTGFVVGDITYTNCFLSSFSTSDNRIYTVTVTPSGVSEDITLSVAAGVATPSNSASTTLTISQWNPVASIGSSVYNQLNFRHSLGKSLSGIESSVLGNTTAEGSGAVAWTSVASGGNTVKYSGDWAYFQGLNGIETTDKTGHRFLHDVTVNWTYGARFWMDADSVANSLHLFQNNNGTSAKRGVSAVVNKTSGNVMTLAFNVTNGGSIVYNNGSVALATVPSGGAWYTIEISKSGGTGADTTTNKCTYTVMLNAVSKLSAFNSGAITGTADSSDNLTIGRTSSTTYAYSSAALIKDSVFINGSLSAGQLTSLRNYLALGREVIGSGTSRNLFAFFGQSLVDGSTPSSTPDATLTGALDAKIFVPTYRTSYSISDTFATLQYGVNNSYNSLTYYGPNLSFAKAASARIPGKVYICQTAKGGIPWYNIAGTDTCWSSANPSSMQRNAVTFQWVQQSLRIHRFQLNSTINLYVYINQGQSDCISTNADAVGADQTAKNAAVQASVKTNATAFIKRFIDETQTAGLSTANLTILIAKMVSTFNPSTPNYTAYVNNAIVDIATNFATDNPTYVGKYARILTLDCDFMTITGDGTHPNDASQKAHGEAIDTALSPYY
jgi:hypothetical protein